MVIVNQVGGFWAILVGLIVLPLTMIAAPCYALVGWGNWIPLAIVYGPWVVVSGVIGIISFFEKGK
jgi:hypothetical protein